jgi:sugar lactone lactonase YvrE
MNITITALDAPIAALGESPVWCPEEVILYWVDIDGKTIHRHDPATGTHGTRSINGRPGSIALTSTPGRLLIASEHRLLELDWDTGAVTPFVDLEAASTGNRLNDGCCDSSGRFVVGSMCADTNAGRTTGTLHRIHHSGEVETLRTHIGVTNGLAFDVTRNRMYFADTPTERVLVFDYEPSTGALSNQRLFFDYHEYPGKPDGACVDADGCYWSASVYGWALLRITPDGDVDCRIELPIQKPSMPCFGGANLDTLFVTTIGAGGTIPSETGRDGFEPGATLAIEGLGVKGIVEPRFAGATR